MIVKETLANLLWKWKAYIFPMETAEDSDNFLQ